MFCLFLLFIYHVHIHVGVIRERDVYIYIYIINQVNIFVRGGGEFWIPYEDMLMLLPYSTYL